VKKVRRSWGVKDPGAKGEEVSVSLKGFVVGGSQKEEGVKHRRRGERGWKGRERKVTLTGFETNRKQVHGQGCGGKKLLYSVIHNPDLSMKDVSTLKKKGMGKRGRDIGDTRESRKKGAGTEARGRGVSQ